MNHTVLIVIVDFFGEGANNLIHYGPEPQGVLSGSEEMQKAHWGVDGNLMGYKMGAKGAQIGSLRGLYRRHKKEAQRNIEWNRVWKGAKGVQKDCIWTQGNSR